MTTRELIQSVIGLLISTLVVPVFLFLSAGTLNWPEAWLYVIMYLIAAIGGRFLVYLKNPDTLRERARSLSSEKIMPGDKINVLLIGILGPLVIMIVAGLDFRFGISPELSATIFVLAVLLVAFGFILAVWALISNPFFSAVARIQDDRGQVVIESGPYKFVRHPGYAGGVISTVATPFVLGSLWALIPGLMIVIVFLIRTFYEDKMLTDELDGYQDYTRKTRFRLVPGIW